MQSVGMFWSEVTHSGQLGQFRHENTQIGTNLIHDVQTRVFIFALSH